MKVPTAVAKEERGFVADLLQCRTTDVLRLRVCAHSPPDLAAWGSAALKPIYQSRVKPDYRGSGRDAAADDRTGCDGSELVALSSVRLSPSGARTRPPSRRSARQAKLPRRRPGCCFLPSMKTRSRRPACRGRRARHRRHRAPPLPAHAFRRQGPPRACGGFRVSR